MIEASPSMLLSALELPVSPRWHEGILWLSDMRQGRILSVGLDGKHQVHWTLPGRWTGGVGFLPGGDAICVSTREKLVLRLDRTGFSVFVDLGGLPDQGINDMIVDGQGRVYVGTRYVAGVWPRSAEPEDAIVLIDHHGRWSVVARGVHHPNGMVITPDGKTFIVSETSSHRLSAFDIQEDGGFANRRVFAGLGTLTPDGICLDASGAVWVTSPFTQELARVEQGGEITHRIRMDLGKRPFACTLGGPGRRTLFFTSSYVATPDAPLDPRGGMVETLPTEIGGAGWP